MLTDPGCSEFPEIRQRLTAKLCAETASAVTDDPGSLSGIGRLREELRQSGIAPNGDALERAILRGAAEVNDPLIGSLPVHESVRARLHEEFRFYTRHDARESFEAGSHLFATGCKVLTLRRFPAGPMDWEISGIPRSWLLRIPKTELPRIAYFLAMRLGGLYPLFFMHVARRPKNRSLLIEKEVHRAYYRMARSLQLQPTIRGIMASAWFHDPAAAMRDPHLAFMNRLYREGGGLITTTGAAPPGSGFLEHNAARKERLEAGELTYRLGLAVWPRRRAVAWAEAHPELED